MNGEPKTSPSNHVEWANGFKSNMPDWPTARRCAHSQKMLTALKGARTLLFAMDLRTDEKWNHAVEQKRFDSILDDICNAIDLAEGMEAVKQAFTMPETNPWLDPLIKRTEEIIANFPPPPGFPKPPGFK